MSLALLWLWSDRDSCFQHDLPFTFSCTCFANNYTKDRSQCLQYSNYFSPSRASQALLWFVLGLLWGMWKHYALDVCRPNPIWCAYVMLCMKTRLIDIVCAWVIKRAGPTRRSTLIFEWKELCFSCKISHAAFIQDVCFWIWVWKVLWKRPCEAVWAE